MRASAHGLRCVGLSTLTPTCQPSRCVVLPMISSCSCRGKSINRALHPATRTRRCGNFSGSFCAARSMSLFTMLTVLGMMRLRMKQPDLMRSYKTFGYPVTPVLFILMNVWIIIFSIIGNPFVTLYGAATITAGIFFYYFRRLMNPRVTAG